MYISSVDVFLLSGDNEIAKGKMCSFDTFFHKRIIIGVTQKANI
jgi:hypothetical protein